MSVLKAIEQAELTEEHKDALRVLYRSFRATSRIPKPPAIPPPPLIVEILETGTYNPTAWLGFFVYSLWDDTGTLLYIGQSTSLATRIAAHHRYSPFRNQIAAVTYERLPDKPSMNTREHELIHRHQPPHNYTSNPTAYGRHRRHTADTPTTQTTSQQPPPTKEIVDDRLLTSR